MSQGSANNDNKFPLWLRTPKMGGVISLSVMTYNCLINPKIMEELPDTRSKLQWHCHLRKRASMFYYPILLLTIGTGLYSYHETKEKNFLYGSIATAMVFPSLCCFYRRGAELKKIHQNVENGGFMTKKEEKAVNEIL